MLASFQTSSLCLDQESTAGTSDGSPVQGKCGGQYPRTHLKGVKPVEEWMSKFCAYPPMVRTCSSGSVSYGNKSKGMCQFLD